MERYLIIKIISKIKIHPLFYVVAFITFITGFFKDFSYIMLIIFVHELGHIGVASYFKWNIDKIIILPFGGLTLFNEKINKPLLEEFIIALAGPLFQIVCFSFFKNTQILEYHYLLLLFNLIPIMPLDGSKILNCLLNYVFSFKLSHVLTIIVSITFASLLLFFKFNLVIILILFFLIIKTLKEYNNRLVIFNKFLMERYMYKLDFHKRKTIKGLNPNKMFRNYKHLFYYDKKYYSEAQILKKMFDIKGLL